MTDQSWPLFEVFLRGKRGLNHVHVGSLHAADPEMALHHARDLYTRRNEGVSIWVVRASDITASSPDEKDPFFKPSGDKVYRHPRVLAEREPAQRALRDMFNLLTNEPERLPAKFCRLAERDGIPRATGDYLAGMTDRFALDEHQRLTKR